MEARKLFDKTLFAVVILPVLLLGCVASPKHPAFQSITLPDLIPKDNFFDQSHAKFDYLVSPDGKKVAWLENYKKHITIHFKDIQSEEIQKIDTQSWCHVTWFKWTQDSRYFIYMLAVSKNRARHIFKSDSQNPKSEPVNLTPEAINEALFFGTLLKDPEYIYLAQKKKWSGQYDFYKVNLTSGADELVGYGKKEIFQWITDLEGNLRGRVRADDLNNLHLEICDAGQSEWENIATWESGENVKTFGVTSDGKGVWLLSNRNRDRMALVRLDFNTGKEVLVCEDPDSDLERVYFSRITGEPLFAYACPDYPKTYVLDAEMENDLAAFKTDLSKGIDVLGMDDSERLWTVKVYDERKESFFLYDRDKKSKDFLGSNQWLGDPSILAETSPIKIQSRDGLELRAYLTRPSGVKNIPMPMVLYVHGGPWARDYWKMDRMVQFIANRGYTVLQVNYRGSEGYGRAYKEAAKKEFAGAMHNDLIDSVEWAVENNIADPKKVAIVGGSYGGFAAMAGLTFTPDVFACGVSINGVSDWTAFIDGFPYDLPLYRKRGFDIWYDYVGNPLNSAERDEIKKRSPLFFADKVQKPILIIYGEQDRRVKPSQSEKMIEALKMSGKKVEYAKFENEGHGIYWSHNTKDMFQKIENFLYKHLGGRSEG